MRAVVLPGLDGSAELLSEFAAALAPEFEATLVSYPPDEVLDYAALREHVRRALPDDEPFLLVAASFSGPIAIELAAEAPPQLIGVVLAASFARRPRRRLRVWSTLLRFVPYARLPAWLYLWALMGRRANRQWRARVRRALAALPPAVLQQRLRDVRRVDVLARVAEIRCPLLYLRAASDRIVQRDSWLALRDRSDHAICIEIPGPHFLLQACPTECAAAIKQ